MKYGDVPIFRNGLTKASDVLQQTVKSSNPKWHDQCYQAVMELLDKDVDPRLESWATAPLPTHWPATHPLLTELRGLVFTWVSMKYGEIPIFRIGLTKALEIMEQELKSSNPEWHDRCCKAVMKLFDKEVDPRLESWATAQQPTTVWPATHPLLAELRGLIFAWARFQKNDRPPPNRHQIDGPSVLPFAPARDGTSVPSETVDFVGHLEYLDEEIGSVKGNAEIGKLKAERLRVLAEIDESKREFLKELDLDSHEFELLSDWSRLDELKMSKGDLAAKLGIQQPTLSNQVKKLMKYASGFYNLDPLRRAAALLPRCKKIPSTVLHRVLKELESTLDSHARDGWPSVAEPGTLKKLKSHEKGLSEFVHQLGETSRPLERLLESLTQALQP